MDSHALLTAWILSAIGLCSCQNQLLLDGPQNGVVGGKVMIKVIDPPSVIPTSVTWVHNTTNQMFLIAGGGSAVIGPGYENRITVDETTFSLELRKLTVSDTGEYTLTILIGQEQRLGKTSLTVQEKIHDVHITSSNDNLIAGESSVSLTCDAQGDIVTREWRKDGKPDFSNRTSLHEGNRTLSISRVQTEDQGLYRCTVRNPASFDHNDFRLQINSPHGSPGISDLAIAFIVIAILILLVIPVVILALKKKGIRCLSKSKEEPTNNGSVELNYADISHFQRTNVQRVDQGNGGNGETLYSGVRLPSSQAGPTSGQGPTYFQNNAVGLRANSGNVGDAVRPKGQAPGPPSQVPDVTYAQVKKK